MLGTVLAVMRLVAQRAAVDAELDLHLVLPQRARAGAVDLLVQFRCAVSADRAACAVRAGAVQRQHKCGHHAADRRARRARPGAGGLYGRGDPRRHPFRAARADARRNGARDAAGDDIHPHRLSAGDARDHSAGRQRGDLDGEEHLTGQRHRTGRTALHGAADLRPHLRDDPAADRRVAVVSRSSCRSCRSGQHFLERHYRHHT